LYFSQLPVVTAIAKSRKDGEHHLTVSFATSASPVALTAAARPYICRITRAKKSVKAAKQTNECA
jgi:hypothetical protein